MSHVLLLNSIKSKTVKENLEKEGELNESYVNGQAVIMLYVNYWRQCWINDGVEKHAFRSSAIYNQVTENRPTV